MASARTTRHELAQDHRPTGIGCARTVPESQVSANYRNLVRQDLAGASLPDTIRQELLAERVRLAPGDRGFSPLASRYGRPLTVVLVMTAILWLVAALNFLSLFVARFTASVVNSRCARRLARHRSGWARRRSLNWPSSLAWAGAPVSRSHRQFAMALLRFVPTQNSPLDMGASIDLRLVGLALGLTVMTMAIVGTYFFWRLRAGSDLDFRPQEPGRRCATGCP